MNKRKITNFKPINFSINIFDDNFHYPWAKSFATQILNQLLQVLFNRKCIKTQQLSKLYAVPAPHDLCTQNRWHPPQIESIGKPIQLIWFVISFPIQQFVIRPPSPLKERHHHHCRNPKRPVPRWWNKSREKGKRKKNTNKFLTSYLFPSLRDVASI